MEIDRNIGAGYLRVAEHLLDRAGDAPIPSATLRRVASSLYYAVYHTLALRFSDILVDSNPTGGLRKAWVEVYRSLDHVLCKNACKRIIDSEFPPNIRSIAGDILQLYEARISSDYDPCYQLDETSLNGFYGTASTCVSNIQEANERDIRALAVWMLMNSHGANLARSLHHNGNETASSAPSAKMPKNPRNRKPKRINH